MGNYGNWRKEDLVREIKVAKENVERTLSIDQEHTDRANDLQVSAWLDELGYSYEVGVEYTKIHLRAKPKPFRLGREFLAVDKAAGDKRDLIERLVYELVLMSKFANLSDDFIVTELAKLGISLKPYGNYGE